MTERILIVEDEFIVANDLRIMLEKAGYKVCGIASSFVKALELIDSKKPDWILLDIFLQGDKTGIDLAGQLSDRDIPFIYISANTNQGILEAAKATLPYGFLVKPFRERDLFVMLDIARYRHSQNEKYKVYQEPSIQNLIENIILKQETAAEKLKQVSSCLNKVLPFDLLWITKASPRSSNKDCYILKTTDDNFTVFDVEEILTETKISHRDFKTWNSTIIANDGKLIFNGYEFRKLRMDHSWTKVLSDHFELESALVANINLDEETFQFIFFSALPNVFSKVHTGIISQFNTSLALIIEKIIYSKEPPVQKSFSIGASVKDVPVKNTEQPINDIVESYGMIGTSNLLQAAIKKMELVASDETSVLILGESGTGKERVAHTIHDLSPRKSKPMVTVNCAALPLTLIESELFGHEKGSFTGASDRRIGKFEQADGGTIFLDEIGELPLEAQVKLLRVLQEKEIERLGGNYTKKINVRIITATNRNLEKEVAEGRFRLDLYYRLNVFPIELPSLRRRKEDIAMLVRHFVNKFTKKSSSKILNVSTDALKDLMHYDWPGNIRELEHLIERTMLLTEGNEILEIELPKKDITANIDLHQNFKIKTMEEMERDHILSILKMCKGKIYGSGGAAELLNIPSTTLNSKIKRLGIIYEFTK